MNKDQLPDIDPSGSTEKKTLDLMRDTVRSTSILSISLLITVPLGFIPKILVPKVLGPEQAGIFYFGETFPLLFLSIITFGIPSFIDKFVPTRPAVARQILDTALLASMLFAAAMLGMLYFFLRINNYPPMVQIVTMILAAMQAMTLLCTTIFQPIFIGIGQVYWTAVFNVVGKVITVVAVFLAIVVSAKIEALAVAFLISQVILFFFMRSKAKGFCLTGTGFSSNTFKMIVSGSFIYLLASVVGQVNQSLNAFLIQKLTSFEELGLYSAGNRLFSVFLLMIPLASQALSPQLAKALELGVDEYKRMFSSALRIILAATFPLSILFTAFGHDVIIIIFGKEYESASYTMATLGPALPLLYLCLLAGMHTFRTEPGSKSLVVVSLGLVVNLVGGLLLIPLGQKLVGTGGGGAAIALVQILVQSFEAFLFFRIATTKVITRNLILKLVACLVPSLLICCLYLRWIELTMTIRVIVMALFLPSYMFLTRLVTRDDLRFLMRQLQGGRFGMRREKYKT